MPGCTFLGAVLSIPAAMACAAALPGPGPVKKAVRFCIQVLRSFPALILALSSGIYLCRKVTDYVRHNEKGVMGPLMKDLLRLFVMHIIPLLMAAAVIEAYVTPQLLKLFL